MHRRITSLKMTNPRPSASTFAIDGGAGEPTERMPLSTVATMDLHDDDHRGSSPSLASLLFGSRALERRYPRVTNVATRREAVHRRGPPILARVTTSRSLHVFSDRVFAAAAATTVDGRQCRGTTAGVTKRARGVEHHNRACEDARTPDSDATRRAVRRA